MNLLTFALLSHFILCGMYLAYPTSSDGDKKDIQSWSERIIENPMTDFLPAVMKERRSPKTVWKKDHGYKLHPWYETNIRTLCNPRPQCHYDSEYQQILCVRYCSRCDLFWQPKENLDKPTKPLMYFIRVKKCRSCFRKTLCEKSDSECQSNAPTCDP